MTAPLTRGDILHGVTRDSVLHLARSDPAYSDLEVSERYLTMQEVRIIIIINYTLCMIYGINNYNNNNNNNNNNNKDNNTDLYLIK